VIDVRRQRIEMVIVHTEDIKNEGYRKRTFSIMSSARVVVTSDKLNIVKLFLMMREAEKAHPSLLSGLCERIVVQIEDEDFQQLIKPSNIKVDVPESNSQISLLCSLLKSWGNCSDEMINYLQDSNIQDPDKLQETLKKALNPDTLRDLITEHRAKKLSELSR
jgi:hypothetical protein